MSSRLHAGESLMLDSRDIKLVLLLLLFTAMLRLPTLIEPWGGDQGVCGYIANGVLEGKVPYRDMYSPTGYGLFFAYALFFKMFGNNMAAIHLGDLLAALLTVVIVYLLAKLLYGRESGVIAGIAAAIFSSGQAFSGLVDMKGAWGTYWQLAQRETFMTPLIAAAILCILLAENRGSRQLSFWAGTFLGLAFVFKATAVLMLVVLMVYLVSARFWRTGALRLKIRLTMVGAVGLGFMAANLPFLAYFWWHGSLSTMYQAVFVHTSIYAKISWGNIVADAFKGNTYILSENLVIWLMTPVSLGYLICTRRSRDTYLMVAWTAATLIMVWGQGKFFGYHFLLIIAPFCVLTGFGLQRILKTEPTWICSLRASLGNLGQLFLWVLLAGNLLQFAWNQYEYYRRSIQYALGTMDRLEYYEAFSEYPLHMYSFRANYEVAQYLKQHGAPQDALREINGGGEIIVNYLTGMKSATRFTSTWYLFNKQLYGNALTAKLRQEFVSEIKNEKPRYLLLVYWTMDEFRKQYEGPEFNDVRDLMDYIESNYSVDKTFRDGRILYRKL